MKRLDYRDLPPELLGAASLNFAAPEDSSARQEMVGSHLSQALVIDGARPRRCTTGMERRFGEATFNIKMPCNGEIKKIIEKYPPGVGMGAIRFNPVTSVIYEDIERGVIDVLDLPYFHCKHNHFGFRYKPTKWANLLSKNTALAKGTVLFESPLVSERGEYSLGTELNVVFMSVPGVLEDGMIISESVVKKLTSNGYEKRFGSWGHRRHPLNLYPGENGEYKPHPDIGERVRSDGLLFAFREYDPLLAGVNMAEDQLKVVDHVFDRRVYAVPNAKVIDVTARKGSSGGNTKTPESMNQQAWLYHNRQKQYYAEINREAENLTKHSNSVKMAPRLHRLIVEGHVFSNELGNVRPKLMYNLQELDEWRVDIAFEYKVKPSIGSKLTDFHGG